jgi:membrane associated rhomboid family serine protease
MKKIEWAYWPHFCGFLGGLVVGWIIGKGF